MGARVITETLTTAGVTRLTSGASVGRPRTSGAGCARAATGSSAVASAHNAPGFRMLFKNNEMRFMVGILSKMDAIPVNFNLPMIIPVRSRRIAAARLFEDLEQVVEAVRPQSQAGDFADRFFDIGDTRMG